MLFIQLMRDGGPVMWVILLCSFIALFIFLEKWLQFHREQINANELLKGLTNVLKRDGYIEAITLCDNTPGPIARVLVAIILSCQRGDKDLRQAVEDANLEEIPKLERHMNILGTIGYIAPLLGLLGTVVGMMHAFQEMGLKCFEPYGAFYVFPCIKEFGMTSEEFAERLLREEKVAVVPGTAFGDCGEGFLRISYAYSLDNLKIAMEKIGHFISRLREEKK